MQEQDKSSDIEQHTPYKTQKYMFIKTIIKNIASQSWL